MSENVLGKGLDALIQDKRETKKEKPKEQEPKKTTRKTVKKTKSKTTKKQPQKSKTLKNNLSEEKIEQIKKEVIKNPRISLWSAQSAAVLKYLKKTEPEFSISNEASKLIAKAIEEKYPEIWEQFDELQSTKK